MLLEAGCWASVEPLYIYSVLTLVATWLVKAAMFACGNTHQVYTSEEERAAALCDNRFLRRGDDFDTSSCDWILSTCHRAMSLIVLLLPGVMSLGKEDELQALTQPRSLSGVSGRIRNAKTSPYHFSIGCLAKIKVKLWGRKATLLSSLQWNPIVTSSGKTGAELKNPDSYFSACVHIMSMIDACFVLNRHFISGFFFPVKVTNVFWLSYILLSHEEVRSDQCAEWTWLCTLGRQLLWVG